MRPACPACSGTDLRRTSSWHTAGIVAGVLALDVVLLANTPWGSPEVNPWCISLIIIGMPMLIMLVIALPAAILGKNNCESRRHNWR